MNKINDLIASYEAGPQVLEDALGHSSESTWDRRPGPGKWSIREVVCHLADAEIVYADRMKRVLMEDQPKLLELDPDLSVAALRCEQRPLGAELALVRSVRTHMLPILKSCNADEFQRIGEHSLEGPMSLRTLLERITNHLPHHVGFINAKIETMKS